MPDLLSQNIDIAQKTLALRAWTSILYKIGSTYYATKFDGTLISSSTTAETVISAALAQKGVLYFAHNQNDGDFTYWNLSAGFSGFTITDHTNIVSDSSEQVYISVPNGYTGSCFKYNGTSGSNPDDAVGMKGISIDEQGTPSRLWTGIKFEIDGTDSLIFTRFQDIFITNASVGIELECSSSQWINGNIFENVNIYNSVTAVLFDQQSGEISGNSFNHVQVQCSSVSADGFKNINGVRNNFINCYVWDMPAAGSEANILSTADKTTIIGGNMTAKTGFGTFTNLGKDTTIIDGNWSKLADVKGARTGYSYQCDFLGTATAAVVPFTMAAVASGTLASANSGIVTKDHPGSVKFVSSTTTNSGVAANVSTVGTLIGGGECYEAIFNITTLTNGTLRFGYIDTANSGDCTDGVYIEVPSTGAAVGKTSNNGTRTTTGTIATLSTATWYRGLIRVNMDATRADFYLYSDAGVQLGTTNSTTNFPTGSGRDCSPGFVMTNSGTSATDLVHLDYIRYWNDRILTRG